MKPIIISLLDTDLYKFTMQQCALRQFSNVWVRYVFKSRNILNWTYEMHEELLNQIKNFCSIHFNKEELEETFKEKIETKEDSNKKDETTQKENKVEEKEE